MRSFLQVFALISPCLLTSCATMFAGDSDKVEFASVPVGAEVVLGDTVLGRTPCVATIDRSTDAVVFRLAGYPNREVEIDSSFQFGYLLMDILFTPGFGSSGIIIDAISGAWFSLPERVECDFTRPAAEKPKPAAVASGENWS